MIFHEHWRHHETLKLLTLRLDLALGHVRNIRRMALVVLGVDVMQLPSCGQPLLRSLFALPRRSQLVHLLLGLADQLSPLLTQGLEILECDRVTRLVGHLEPKTTEVVCRLYEVLGLVLRNLLQDLVLVLLAEGDLEVGSNLLLVLLGDSLGDSETAQRSLRSTDGYNVVQSNPVVLEGVFCLLLRLELQAPLVSSRDRHAV